MRYLTMSLGLLLTMQVNAQNVGIGTTTPAARLHVEGVSGAGRTAAIFGNEQLGVSLQTNWPTIGFNQYRDAVSGTGKYFSSGYAATIWQDPGSGTMGLDMLNTGAGGTNTPIGYRSFTILNNGLIGIRNANPIANLHVSRGDGVDGTVVFAGPAVWSHFNYSSNEDTYIRSGTTNGTIYLNQAANGRVGMGSGATKISQGTNVPLYTIDQPMDATFGQFKLFNDYNHSWSQNFFYNSAANEYELGWRYNNLLKGYFIASNGYYTNGSDAVLKEDIKPMEPVLQKIRQLNPVSYEMIYDNPSKKRSLGFIAQEVKMVFPSFVHIINDHNRNGKETTDLHTLSYNSFHVIAIKALQEQQEQIMALEEENKLLHARLLKLKARLEKR